MKRFNFRLEKIKRYKEQLEQEKRMNLATKRRILALEKEKLSEIVLTQRRYFAEYGARRTGRLNLGQLIIAKRYLDKLSRDIAEQSKNVKHAEAEVAKAQNEFIVASKEKKKYEKLKEKHKAAYDYESLLAENRELDEFGARAKASALATA